MAAEGQAKAPVRVALQWLADSPWRVGSGEGALGGTLLDARRCPYVPGSSLKGRVKHMAQGLYRGRFGRLCPWQAWAAGQEPDPQGADALPGVGDWAGARSLGCGCDLCVLFGCPGGQRAALSYPDLYPPEGEAAVQWRWGVALDPARRAVAGKRLFALQVVAPPADAHQPALQGQIRGWLPADARHGERLGLLVAALGLVRQLGGGAGAGLGWGRMRVALEGGPAPEEWVAPWI